jgi:hypothetical protein
LSRKILDTAHCGGQHGSAIGGGTVNLVAARSSDFLGSIGVNTHLNDIANSYGSITQIISEISYLGLGTFRDVAPYRWTAGTYVSLASAGFNFDIIAAHGDEDLSGGALSANLGFVDEIGSSP